MNHSEWLKQRSRELRKNQTVPERILWQLVRGRKLAGLKFVRQYVIGKSIVDFVCREHHLVLEIDGDSHADRGLQDRDRQAALESQGLRVLRIANDDVLQNLEGVAVAIVNAAGMDGEK